MIDTWKLPRATAALGAGLVITLIGVPSAYSTNVLAIFDQVAGNLFLVFGAFALTIFVGWRMDYPVTELQQGFRSEGLLRGWHFTLKFFVPIILAVVLYQVGKDTALVLYQVVKDVLALVF